MKNTYCGDCGSSVCVIEEHKKYSFSSGVGGNYEEVCAIYKIVFDLVPAECKKSEAIRVVEKLTGRGDYGECGEGGGELLRILRETFREGSKYSIDNHGGSYYPYIVKDRVQRLGVDDYVRGSMDGDRRNPRSLVFKGQGVVGHGFEFSLDELEEIKDILLPVLSRLYERELTARCVIEIRPSMWDAY